MERLGKMSGPQKKLGEILIEKGFITAERLKHILDEQAKTKEFLGKILLERKQIKENDLLEVLSGQFNIPIAALRYKYIDWETVNSFSASLILDYKCFPLQKDERSVTFAISNPLDARVLRKAEEEARGVKVKFVLASAKDIDDVIARYKQYIRGNIARIFR